MSLHRAAINRFGCRMRQVFGQRPVDGQTLRGDSNASRTALLLEVRAPAIDFGAVSAHEFLAAYSHLRIIII